MMSGTGDSMNGTGESMNGTGESMNGTCESMNGTGESMNGTGTSNQEDSVIVGTFIHCVKRGEVEVLLDTAVGVQDGKIVFIDKKENLAARLDEFSISSKRCIHLENSQFIIPGFVDSHAHAPQYPFMGVGGDLPLLPWLDKYTFPTEAKVASDYTYAEHVYRTCVTRTLRCGSTTVCYYATISTDSTILLVDVIESLGQRSFVGKVNMDQESPDYYTEETQTSIQDTRRFIENVIDRKNPLITPCITPRFAISCSSELMSGLAKLRKEFSLPVQSHISENKDEIDFVSKLFPDCQTYADVYDQAGLLGEQTILGHGVHLVDSELQLLRDRGSGVSHCPNSNFCLHSGVLDVRRPLQAGVKVGLGTDFAGGNSPSMLDAIRRGVEAASVTSFGETNPQDRLTYKDMFYLATLGSCRVMGLEESIGNFQQDKDFDALLIDPEAPGSPMDVFPGYSIEETFQKFIFQGDDRNIRQVFVRGRALDLSTPPTKNNLVKRHTNGFKPPN